MKFAKTIKPKHKGQCSRCGLDLLMTHLVVWEPKSKKVYHVKCYKTQAKLKFTRDKTRWENFSIDSDIN